MLKQVGLEKQQNYILRKYEKVFKSGSQLLLTDGRCHINMRGFIIPLVPFTERRFIDMRNKKILFYILIYYAWLVVFVFIHGKKSNLIGIWFIKQEYWKMIFNVLL